MKYLLPFIFILSACAPMPQGKLLDGLERPTPIEEVDVTISIGFWETNKECNRRMSKGLIILNCLLNFCIVPGCATITYDNERVKKCEIRAIANWNWIIKHELAHCEGYDDIFY